MSGKFEVYLGNKLIHSKLNGNGFVDSEVKFQKIVKAINEAI